MGTFPRKDISKKFAEILGKTQLKPPATQILVNTCRVCGQSLNETSLQRLSCCPKASKILLQSRSGSLIVSCWHASESLTVRDGDIAEKAFHACQVGINASLQKCRRYLHSFGKNKNSLNSRWKHGAFRAVNDWGKKPLHLIIYASF